MHPVIPVFMASPGDVPQERLAVKRAVESLAPRLTRIFGVALTPVLWEDFAPISPYDASHPQFGILQRIEPFSIFVGILAGRHGTPVEDAAGSGTEAEFDHALGQRDRIAILTYFKETGSGPSGKRAEEDPDQEDLVRRLKKRLQGRENVRTQTYSTVEDFESRIGLDLMEAALELILSQGPKNLADYVKIFRFGSHRRQRDRPLLIVYPPLTDPGPGHELPRLNWRERLLPNVVYEDSKAIQDLEEVLRLLGREYKTVTTDSPDLDIANPGDRIWVCLPRNDRAKRILGGLAKLGRDIRFDFSPKSFAGEHVETVLRWRHQNGKWQTIRSPLRKYLEMSNRPSEEGPWHPAYGYSYGRDYAVFARFVVPKSWDYPQGEWTYHYFVGGIRGLGTWGVGYLIDHESSALLEMVERSSKRLGSEDAQILLEVTYENFRITRVRDVSDWPAKEFRKRGETGHIRRKLSRRSAWRA